MPTGKGEIGRQVTANGTVVSTPSSTTLLRGPRLTVDHSRGTDFRISVISSIAVATNAELTPTSR